MCRGNCSCDVSKRRIIGKYANIGFWKRELGYAHIGRIVDYDSYTDRYAICFEAVYYGPTITGWFKRERFDLE